MTVPKNIPNSSIEWRVEPHAHARICVLAPYRHARVKVYELGTPAGIHPATRARASWWDDAKIGPHLAQTLAKEGQNHSGVSRVGGVGPPSLRGAGAGAGVISAFISTPWPGE